MIITRNHEKMRKILSRGDVFDEKYLNIVMDILKDVKNRGDSALEYYTAKFDKHDIRNNLTIEKTEMKKAYDNLDNKVKKALIRAELSIRQYHEKQLETTWLYSKKDGVMLGQKVTPIARVGIYVPGGKAVYPSSVLMNSVPANVAGVSSIVMTTPAINGEVQDIVLAAAYMGGVDKVYKIGGAQAIGALAYGTESVEKVDKIVGPGNIFVALAKKIVFGTVDIDMIAGPSEITIIADDSANPGWIAADMLSQAEHDEMASSVLITCSENLAENVQDELSRQLRLLPKKEIAERSLNDFGAIVVVKDMNEAVELSDKIAPEHLELCVEHPYEIMLNIKNAGAIFMGHYCPEAIGDYIAGPNHTLPTGGSARFFSPLGTYDFVKKSSLIKFSREAMLEVSDDVMSLADTEELSAHRNSIKIRI
jgi:histidinol dehydrogenase